MSEIIVGAMSRVMTGCAGELLTCQLIHSLVNKLLTSEKISEYLLEIMQQEVLDTTIVCKFLYIGHKYAIQ